MRFMLGACLLSLIFSAAFPAALPAAGSPEVQEVLELCADGAYLDAGEIPACMTRVDRLIDQLEREADPRNKLWLFRLQQCRSFLAFRLEVVTPPAAPR